MTQTQAREDTIAQQDDTPAPKRGGIWRALATGLSAGILAVILGIALVTIIIPRASGSTALTVLTGSMEPRLPPGTLLVVRPKPIDDIRIGDVVTYEPNPNDATVVISHRVIAITSGTDGSRVFTVKGDANNTPDAPVQSKQVVAVLWYSVPWIGWVNSWMTGAGRSWFIPLAAVLLFGYAAWNFASGFIDRGRKRRALRSDPDRGRKRRALRSDPDRAQP